MCRRSLLALCALVVAMLGLSHRAYSALQHPPSHLASAQISLALAKQQTAWNQGDVDAFMAGYWNSPDLTFSGSNGISRGWEAVTARYRRSYPDQAAMGHLDFSDLEIRPLGEKSALVLGKWHLRRTSGDIGGVFTLVFQQFPEGWKIIHDHTSQVASKNP